MCQKDFTGYHIVRADKLSYDDLMIGFCGAPERERVEKLATRDKLMKVFEAAKAAAAVKTKGMIFKGRGRERESERERCPSCRP